MERSLIRFLAMVLFSVFAFSVSAVEIEAGHEVNTSRLACRFNDASLGHDVSGRLTLRCTTVRRLILTVTHRDTDSFSACRSLWEQRVLLRI